MSEIAPATVGVSANRGIVLLPLLRGGPALLWNVSVVVIDQLPVVIDQLPVVLDQWPLCF